LVTEAGAVAAEGVAVVEIEAVVEVSWKQDLGFPVACA
jgi:hypothetical protein